MTLSKNKDAARKGVGRKESRDITFGPPADLARRRQCLADPIAFMSSYFGWIFWQPFTPSRKAMVEAIIHAARYGGDYGVADLRGGGKSATALFTAFWLDLRRELRLPLIIGKNQRGAEIELDNLKRAIVESPDFTDDFPEICQPIIALDDWASAARKQTVGGVRTKIGWEKDCLFLPTVPQEALPSDWPKGEPSVACGQGLAVVGIDGKIRGFKRRNVRPDGAIIDDIDDRESARSITQTRDHCVAIDQDVIGLAGTGRRTFRVMLCTTLNDKCAAAIYTNKPGWRSHRFAAIVKMPVREDLRDEYIDLRKGRTKDDPDARVAHKFYLDNQEEIERGGEVGNPYDFNHNPGPDGGTLEVSAFQRYFNFIADTSWDAFRCEFQNDPPPAEDAIVKAGISRELILTRVSGFKRRELPPQCGIVAGIDLGKMACHWVAGAFREGGACAIPDYGVVEVQGTEKADDKKDRPLIEKAILRALISWKDYLSENPFCDADGNPLPIERILIDSGYYPDAVYEFVRMFGEPFRASKGIGGGKFHHGQQSATRRVGKHWFSQLQRSEKVWLYSLDVDHWKRQVHERFIASPIDETNRVNPGSLTIFVTEGRRDHHAFASHIMAEEWITEFVEAKGERSKWLKHSGNNHYFDATAYMLAAAEMAGYRVFHASKQKQPMSLQAMAAEARK